MSHFRTPRQQRPWFGDVILASFLFAQVLDGVLTYLGVARFGPGAEGNPILSWLMGEVGEGPALAAAKILAGSCGVALHLRAVHYVVALLTGMYFTVAIVPWTRMLFLE